MSAVLKTPLCRFLPMRETDLDTVMRIEKITYPHPWTYGIFRDCLKAGYSCWLLEQNSVVLGYGVMSVAVGEAHILNICIHPQHQGQGLGRELMEYLLHLARRHNAATMFLEVRPSNIAACILYENLGFNEVGLRRNYYPDKNGREDALILALEL